MQETTENPAIFIPPKAGEDEIEEARAAYEALKLKLNLTNNSEQSLAEQLFANPRFNTVFFDLDGTLLPIDTHRFLKEYAQSLDAFMQSHIGDTELFWYAFNKASQAMLKPRDGFTNEEEFWEQFMEAINDTSHPSNSTLYSRRYFEELLNLYYQEEFARIGPQHPPLKEAALSVRQLKDKGYRVVLATMPVFPRMAVEARLTWAGLDIADFDFVTSIENQSAAKPDKAYYQGILNTLGLTAEEVLMVGNNTFDDALCVSAGIPIYLLDNFLIANRGLTKESLPHSSFEVFSQLVEGLSPCDSI